MKITEKDIVNGGCDREVFVNEAGKIVGIGQGLIIFILVILVLTI